MATYPIILYDSVFLDGVPAATNTAAGYDVLNIRDYRSYTYWRANAAGTLYITVDAGAAVTADALGIYKHNFGTAACKVTVQCSSDNFAGDTTEALAEFTPTTDYAILKTFTQKDKRYWRLKMVTAAIAPELAILMIGDRITFPSIPRSPHSLYSKRKEVITEQSKTGHILGSVVKFKPLTLSYTFPPAESNYTWWATTYKTFWDNHASEMKPFFFGLDLTNYAADAFWVTMDEGQEYALNMAFTGRVEDMTLTMKGIAET